MSKVVPEGWVQGELAEFCDVVGGGTPDRNNPDFWGGDIPWVSPTEITGNTSKYISQTKEKITEIGLEKSSAKLHPAGTLLMTSRASIGFVAINTVPMATNQGFQSLRCKKKVLVDFLYQYIIWSRPQLERLAAGSTFAEISSANVKRMTVCFPSVEQQQKIATILSSVDNVIEKTRTQIDKLKDLKTGMMQELLTKGIGHTEFKDSPVGRIPKSWRAGTLSEFVEINPRLAQRSELQEKTLVSFIRMEDVSNRSVVENVRVVMYEQVSKGFTAFQNQDVLLAKITPCFENGKGGFVDNLHSGVGFGSTEFHVLRAKENVSPHFVYQLINYPEFRIKGAANMTGSAGQRRVPTDYLKSYEIAFPPLIEQQKIVKILQSIDSNISAENQKLASVEQTKKALMQELLTGKVRVNF